ncbi:hypothetical protein FSP39_019190 [Pinctada imbricata]|uniref:ABC transporter domain-containing protein n=1 Tax=Pinctada imbricata TaxID=66713 RepID=A0AA88YQ47_PINIB|nr:hypothetical protein FSP39_019190 [Pinctada imbricata]
MWKNYTLQKRKKCVTAFEIIMPAFFAVILFLLRFAVDTKDVTDPSHWPSFKPNEVEFENASQFEEAKVEMLHYPNTQIIQRLLADALQFMPDPPHKVKVVKGFDSQEALLRYYELYYPKVKAAVVFDQSNKYNSTLPNDVHYTLRVAGRYPQDEWETANTFPFGQNPGYRTNATDGGYPGYQKTGFLAMQYAINKAIILTHNPSADFSNIQLSLKKMPYPPFRNDPLIELLQTQLPLFFLLGFILSAMQTTKNLVDEKQKKLKESMMMMGLDSFIYWLSWFVKSMIYLSIASALFTILFTTSTGNNGKVLNYTDASLFYCFLLLYSVSVVCFCFMISTFFKSANAAAYLGSMLFYLNYLPYDFLQQRYEIMTRSQKMIICILNNMGMAFGVNTIALYERTGEGAKWNNFINPAVVDDNFSLGDAMLMLVISSILYLLIFWYIGNVFPGEYGVPKPFYFPFTKSYWLGGEQSETQELHDVILESEHFEKEPTELKVGITVKNLRKVFGRGKKKKVAVDNTCLNMYEGQITALLGHNGAGKTTTMSLLSGFIPPTSGTARVNGYDIRKEIQNVRLSLGLCPQHNTLFDNLSVEEHLTFFAKLKGFPDEEVKRKVTEMMGVLGLTTMASKLSSSLSGGQKRKLSMGIALVAGPKVVFLDEPTSGMDPAARRQTWEILKKYKEGRTIVLCTHFMDEADILGDRIAIMAEGVVECCGSSLFLKKLYGAGYHLIMVKGRDCDVDMVTDLVKDHIPSAELESEISAELKYLLPFHESHKFVALFEALEETKEKLGLESYGTSATTMEEVFLKVGESAKQGSENVDNTSLQKQDTTSPRSENDENTKQTNGKNSPTTENENETYDLHENEVPLTSPDQQHFIAFNKNLKKNTGVKKILQQFWGMFVKKMIHTLRNRIICLIQLACPVVLTIFALSINKAVPHAKDEPALILNLDAFKDTVTFLSQDSSNAFVSNLASNYSNIFERERIAVEDTGSTDMDEYILSKAESLGIGSYKKRFAVAGDFKQDGSSFSVTAYFNGEPYHAISISLGYMMEAFLKYFTSAANSITTSNFPLPTPADESSKQKRVVTTIFGFVITFFILFGMTFLSTSFIIFIIKERSSGSKHIQKVSGASAYMYWCANFAWDIINYLLPVVLILVCFAVFDMKAYTGGLASMIAVFVLKVPDLNVPEFIGDVLDWLFMIFVPNYCLGRALLTFYSNFEYHEICTAMKYEEICPDPSIPFHACCPEKCGDRCLPFEDNYLAWKLPGAGRYCLFMVVQAVFYFTCVLLIEFRVFKKMFFLIKSKTSSAGSSLGVQEAEMYRLQDDDDVNDEKRRINETPIETLMNTDSLILQNLRKKYGPFEAVKDICVGIPVQECFGLLGQNGAGKTSTFKMLTGDTSIKSGDAFLDSFSIKYSLEEVHQRMGYCPQFDALIEQMTGRETLTMYARLRGVKEEQIKVVVNELLDTLMLRSYADKQTKTYSGGNKRKLSTAIALIGDPPFVLLDEPTTGMDPGARRQLWNVLSEVRASGRTLILTSHSMEECDALCTKIVIMVNGRFVCYGSPQHLKNKFGQGYTLTIRLKSNEDGAVASP